MSQSTSFPIATIFMAVWLVLFRFPAAADEMLDVREELRRLREQNSEFQKQLQQQQVTIQALSRQVSELRAAETKTESGPSTASIVTEGMNLSTPTINAARINLSGEGGAAFFKSRSEGMSPKGEFRLDEARLFLEAPISDNIFFYGELNLATREQPDVTARLGELYVDIENVSQLWNRDHQLNARAGRLYIPFGEEYLTRYAIDNPFISHSLSDLWGVDEGLELYGHAGKLSYVAAVQNGSIPDTSDFTSDKSLAGRVGFDPNRHVHLSVSAMRTGQINVQQDQLSALWFGSGFFRSIGSAATTRFHAELVEGDLQARVLGGQFKAFGGYVHYHDNDPVGGNARDMYYYSVEGVHDIFGKLYGAARFSQILANGGYPLVGDGAFGEYYYGPLTSDLWRLSLDLGYRWSNNFLMKAEYSFERGRTLEAENRNSEDFFAVEAAFRF